MSYLPTVVARLRSTPRLTMVVVVLIIWGVLGAPPERAASNSSGAGLEGNDIELFARLTARVAGGEDYYAVYAEELPARGYASQSVFNWRLPTLVWLNALLPSIGWSQGILISLAYAVTAAWIFVVRRHVPRAATGCVPVLVLGVGAVFMRNSVLLYETWCGLLIAGSLAAKALGRPRLSVCLGVAAVSIRELALPFVMVMAVAAWREAQKREASAWVGVMALFGAGWFWHASRVLPLIPPEGASSHWLALGGWGFALATSQANSFLMLLPPWLVAVILPVVLAGFWFWPGEVGRRVAAVVTGYFALFMVIGHPENWYWGFLIAPLTGLGALGYLLQPPEALPPKRHASRFTDSQG